MEAVLLTAVLVLLMGAALIVLGRGWPRSSRLGGYRARTRAGAEGSAAHEQERGEAIREDDDVAWRWDGDPDDGSRPS